MLDNENIQPDHDKSESKAFSKQIIKFSKS
jgi:hypothetical protein